MAVEPAAGPGSVGEPAEAVRQGGEPDVEGRTVTVAGKGVAFRYSPLLN
jgi:hypothetical protein